jgi:tRNA(fMet)-specific endonuclease VapC
MGGTSPSLPATAQSLLDLLRNLIVLPLDETVARKFGEIRAWQLDHGLASPDLDLLNASVSLVHNFVMVTHNIQDYSNIPGLTLDDWLVS